MSEQIINTTALTDKQKAYTKDTVDYLQQLEKNITETVDGNVVNKKITTEDQYGSVATVLATVKTRIKQIEETRKSFTDPLREVIEKFTGIFAPAKELATTVKDRLETMIKDYHTEQRLKAAAEQRRQAEEQKKIEDEAARLAEEAANKAKEAAETGSVVAINEAEALQEQAKKVQMSVPAISSPSFVAKSSSVICGKSKITTTVKENWKHALVDISLVPDAYTQRVLNDKVIAAAISSGVRNIPGLHIYNDPIVNTTTKR